MRDRGFSGTFRVDPEPSQEVFAEPGNSVAMTVTGVFDETSARAVAKIAVNYLAYEYEGVARMANFADIRRFIRYGGADWRRFVSVSQKNAVANLSEDIQVAGHMVAVTWEPVHGAVIGQVSLLNWALYRINMGGGFVAFPPTYVKSGKFFDPSGRKIHRMTTADQPTWDPRAKK